MRGTSDMGRDDKRGKENGKGGEGMEKPAAGRGRRAVGEGWGRGYQA